MDTDYESSQTGYSFLFLICTLIANLLIAIGIVLVSVLVFAAEEEIEVLRALPEVDTRVFEQEVREPAVFVPFVASVLLSACTIALITTESKTELWLWARPGLNLWHPLYFALAVQVFATLVISRWYLGGWAHYHHVLHNCAIVAQLLALAVYGSSRLSDLRDSSSGRRDQALEDEYFSKLSQNSARGARYKFD